MVKRNVISMAPLRDPLYSCPKEWDLPFLTKSLYTLKKPGFLHVGRGSRQSSNKNRRGAGSMDDSINGTGRITGVEESTWGRPGLFRGKEGT